MANRRSQRSVTIHPNAGRPSHCYHSYLIANLRLVLGVDVTPGNETESLPGLLGILDDLPCGAPILVRGDRGYGNELVMSALEERGQDYLLKLPMRKWAKELVANYLQKAAGLMRVRASMGRVPNYS